MTPEQFYNSKGRVKIKFDRRRHTVMAEDTPFLDLLENLKRLPRSKHPVMQEWCRATAVTRKGPYVYCGTSDYLDRIWMNVNTKAIVKQTPDMYITRFLDD